MGNLFIYFAWNSGAPPLGGPLDFVHPAHPIATPLPKTKQDLLILLTYSLTYLLRADCQNGQSASAARNSRIPERTGV